MSWTNVKLILMREIRDQFRDRRTLFMVAVLPLLLYPVIGIGMVQMMVLFREQPRTVVVVNHHDLPGPPLLEGDRFNSRWFEDPLAASKLKVVTSETVESAEDPQERARQEKLLESAERVLEIHRKVEALRAQQADASTDGVGETEPEGPGEADEIGEAERKRAEVFVDSGIQVLVVVPEGLAEQVREANRRIQEREPLAEAEREAPLILHNKADEKSLLAFSRTKRAFSNWERTLLAERLRDAGLPPDLHSPIGANEYDLARDEDRSASLWSKLLPALVVLMTVTGAFYPAVDVAAGEKERGTMETLLICPASRAEIVLGKFFTVFFFSIGTATLNLFSMGLTGKYMASFAATGLSVDRLGSLAPPSLISLVWVAALMIPLAALFSSLCLALATFARSSKEGQYYLYPLLVIVIGLTVFCLSPTVELEPRFSILPVVGPLLLLKELLSASGNPLAIYYAPVVLLTSVAYAAISLWWAIDQFSREDVLFREAERFELGLWLKQVMRDKEAKPKFAEAGLCFLIIMLLQFGMIRYFQQASMGVEEAERPVAMLRILMVQQVAVIAAPALLMGVMLTRSFRQTFRLYLPPARFLVAGLILPFALHPLVSTLMQNLDWFFGETPEELVRAVEAMRADQVPVWMAFLAFAVAPGICEELTFRGFILSGFEHRGRIWLGIVLSALTFGVMHVFPQQVFHAALLGLVLGWIAVKSNSLLPGVLFHICFNGYQVMLSRAGEEVFTEGPLRLAVDLQGETLRYKLPFLILCAVLAVAVMTWLVVVDRRKREESKQ